MKLSRMVKRLAVLVGDRSQPLDVLLGEPGCVQVQGVPGGLVVLGVVNPAGDRRVVVAEDGHGHHLPHHVGALLGLRPVTDRIAEADELIDLFLLVGLLDRFQGWEVGVDISRAHPT